MTEGTSDWKQPPGAGLRQQVIRSAGWVAFEKWGSRVTTLIVFAILGRLLAPSDFGVVAMATVFLAFSTVFVDGGFAQALVQRKRLDEIHATTAFWISVGLSLVAALLLVLLAPLIDAVVPGRSMTAVIQVMSLNIPLVALGGIPAAVLQRELKFKVLSLRRLVGVLGGATIALTMAWSGAGVWALAAQSLATNLIGLLILWGASSWRPRLAFSRDAAADMWSVGASVMGIETLALANSQADKFLVGTFAGPTALGYYFVGSRIVQILLEILTAASGQLSLPTFARMQEDRERVARTLYRMTFATASLSFLLFGAAAALAPYVVPLIFGDHWTPSVVIMQWLALASALISVAWFHKGLLIAIGEPRPALRLVSVQTVVGLVLVGATLPLSIVAVAASRSLAQLIVWPSRLLVLRRTVPISIRRYVGGLVPPIAAASCAAALVVAAETLSWLPSSPVMSAGVLLGLGVPIYLGVLAATGRNQMGGIARVLKSRRSSDLQSRHLGRVHSEAGSRSN